jgi:hypothetical protein
MPALQRARSPRDTKLPISCLTTTLHGRTMLRPNQSWQDQPLSVNEDTREGAAFGRFGVPQDDIARIVGCGPKILRKHFRDELDRGVAEANAKIAEFLFAAATAGNIAAMIFWMKTGVQWRSAIFNFFIRCVMRHI